MQGISLKQGHRLGVGETEAESPNRGAHDPTYSGPWTSGWEVASGFCQGFTQGDLLRRG